MSNKPKTQVILAAGGQGRRLKSKQPKAFVPLLDKPMLLYSLEVFARSALIDSVIIVCPMTHIKECEQIVADQPELKVSRIIAGGERRRDSVYAGLKALAEDAQYVLIHDAARPFVTEHLVEEVMAICYDDQAAIAAVPVKATIKRASQDLEVLETVEREDLWEIQTPQAFERQILLEAHEHNVQCEATDDAYLLERLGKKVRLVRADDRNIKITTTEDVVLAEAILSISEESQKK